VKDRATVTSARPVVVTGKTIRRTAEIGWTEMKKSIAADNARMEAALKAKKDKDGRRNKVKWCTELPQKKCVNCGNCEPFPDTYGREPDNAGNTIQGVA
jgi:hypothetical protein